MAFFLVAVTVLIVGVWDKTFLADAQDCVDGSRFEEQVLYVGKPPYRLNCPLELQSSPQPKLSWLMNCQGLLTQEDKTYLEFSNLSLANQGNYTCMQQGNSTASFTVRLIVKEPQCSKAPEFQPHEDQNRIFAIEDTTVTLNCTALLLWDPTEEPCDTTLQWSKEGQPLTNHTDYMLNTSSWSPVAGQLMVNSLLMINLTDLNYFGPYSCTVRNTSSDFRLIHSTIIMCPRGPQRPNHRAAVITAIIILLLLAVAALVYSRCHLNIKLWYKKCDVYKFANFISKV